MPWPPWKTRPSTPPSVARADVRFTDPSLSIPTRPGPPPNAGSSVKPAIVVPTKDETLDLTPFATSQVKAKPPPMPLPAQASPHFRFLLLNIGANITKLLVAKAKTPEDVAALVGVDTETIYQIMSGREADVSISVLDGIFTALGATFVPNVVVPTNSSPSAA